MPTFYAADLCWRILVAHIVVGFVKRGSYVTGALCILCIRGLHRWSMQRGIW